MTTDAASRCTCHEDPPRGGRHWVDCSADAAFPIVAPVNDRLGMEIWRVAQARLRYRWHLTESADATSEPTDL